MAEYYKSCTVKAETHRTNFEAVTSTFEELFILFFIFERTLTNQHVRLRKKEDERKNRKKEHVGH